MKAINPFRDQEQFMKAASQDVKAGFTNQADLYAALIKEEFMEFWETQEQGYDGHETDAIKEAIDILVVTIGWLNTVLGPLKAGTAWQLVHETNIAKVTGNLMKRDDGKVIVSKEFKEELKAKLKKDLIELLANG